MSSNETHQTIGSMVVRERLGGGGGGGILTMGSGGGGGISNFPSSTTANTALNGSAGIGG